VGATGRTRTEEATEDDSVAFVNGADVSLGMTVLLLVVSLMVRGKRDVGPGNLMVRVLPMTSLETR
jgi:hypothetical protein